MNNINNDIYYIGVNDTEIDLFEGQYIVDNGMCYNSYIVLDEKISVFDTVDSNFTNEWLNNIKEVLEDRLPDYLIIQHMEPDHSANIANFMNVYPNTTIVANAKTFKMIEQFFKLGYEDNRLVVNNNDTLNTGKHTFNFIFAPMVHWPEVMLTYDTYSKTLFSADAFGTFGILDSTTDWKEEARRYYIGIVGKYGMQVQRLLKQVSTLDIQCIAPLHGPILDNNLSYYLDLYNTWSSYQVEEEGIVIAYSSIYSNTKEAILLLEKLLKDKYKHKVVLYDLARSDISLVVSEAFKYSKLVLASITYNADVFPHMSTLLEHLVSRIYQNRTVAFIENGTWAPIANKVMKTKLENCKNLTICNNLVTITSALDNISSKQIENLANELIND